MASRPPAPPTIFSNARRMARALRYERLAQQDPASQFLRTAAAEDIAERLDFMQVAPCRADLHGDATALLAQALEERGFTVRQLPAGQIDEEQPYPPGDAALIVSLFALDTVNDLPGALIHLRRALPKGGLFIACLTGAGSLPALRQILLAADGERPAARIHPQIDSQAASALMQRAGFARQVVDTHTLNVSYRSLKALVADLRAQGLTNVLADAPPPLSRAGLERGREAFDALADSEGRVTERFEIVTLTGWG